MLLAIETFGLTFSNRNLQSFVSRRQDTSDPGQESVKSNQNLSTDDLLRKTGVSFMALNWQLQQVLNSLSDIGRNQNLDATSDLTEKSIS